MTRRVDIIIPTFNQSQFTINCLASIARHTHPNAYRVIWVDNGSQPSEVAAVKKAIANMPHFAILNDENLGFVKATNQGIATSKGDVVLLNNDTEVPKGWLANLQGGLELGYSIVGPLADEKCTGSWQCVTNVLGSRWFKSLTEGAVGYVEVPQMIAFFCAYIARPVFQEIGYLSEAYGVGFADDDDFCQRARISYFRIAVHTGTIVTHHHRTTFTAVYGKNRWKEMQEENLRILKTRWHMP